MQFLTVRFDFLLGLCILLFKIVYYFNIYFKYYNNLFFFTKVYVYENFENTKLGKRWIPVKSHEYSGNWAIEPRFDDVLQDGDKGVI